MNLECYGDFEYKVIQSVVIIPLYLVVGVIEMEWMDAVRYKWGPENDRNEMKELLEKYKIIIGKLENNASDYIEIENDAELDSRLYGKMSIILDSRLFIDVYCIQCKKKYNPAMICHSEKSNKFGNSLHLYETYSCELGHHFHIISKGVMHFG